jgi:hypothetical protein
MFEFLGFMNVLLFLFFLITVPMFLAPLCLAIFGFIKKKVIKSTVILIGYILAFLFGMLIGFDESVILLFIVYTFFFLSWYFEKRDYDLRFMIISISLAMLFFAGIGILFNAPFGKISPVGVSLTEQQMLRDIKLIASKKIRINSVEVWRNDYHQNVKVNLAKADSRIIMVHASTKHTKDNFSEPFHVQEAMKIFLYLKDRKLLYEVAGVNVSVSHKWVAAELPQVLIGTSEFESIYSTLNKKHVNEAELVRRLSDLWIKRHEPPKQEFEIKG